jgi:heme-degrading monooxygenase HmoA
MRAVLRRYRVRLGTVGAAAAHAERSLLPLIKQLPGFVAHYLLDTGGGIAVSLTLFETRTAAEASHRVLNDWFRSDWPAFQQIPPRTARCQGR